MIGNDPFVFIDAGSDPNGYTARASIRGLIIYLCWLLGISCTVSAVLFVVWLVSVIPS